MATQWYFQAGGEEGGPVAFRELIELVRSGRLNEADLVRSSWKTEWQPAASVVGLFYMAGRSAEELSRLSAAREPATARDLAETGDAVAAQEADEAPEDRAAWMERLDEIVDLRGAPPAETPLRERPVAEPSAADETGPEVPTEPAGVESAAVVARPRAPQMALSTAAPAPRAGNAWSEVVDEALVAVDARRAATSDSTSPARAESLFSRIGRFIPRSDAAKARLRLGFRAACAIVCASLVAYAVENHSRWEDLRFPDRKPPPQYKAIVRCYFPVVGRCKRRNYLYLTSGLTLATAAGAWFAAGWLASRTD